jgi:hypothetical protein
MKSYKIRVVMSNRVDVVEFHNNKQSAETRIWRLITKHNDIVLGWDLTLIEEGKDFLDTKNTKYVEVKE